MKLLYTMIIVKPILFLCFLSCQFSVKYVVEIPKMYELLVNPYFCLPLSLILPPVHARYSATIAMVLRFVF